MTVDDLIARWSALPAPAIQGELSGVRVPGMLEEPPVWIARDVSGRRHILIEVVEGSQPLQHRATRALEVRTDRLRVAGAPAAMYIDLTCVDAAHERTFAAVAQDIIAAVKVSGADRLTVIVRTLDRWRSFWSVDPAGLSREAALGLFGELWFMSRWMEPIAVALVRWQGPAGARHDFQWETASVEVKTSATVAGPVVHRVANIDQLADPETGTLYLFSLQVADDAIAANSLPALIDRITELLTDYPDASRLFADRLGQAGYSPAHVDRYRRPLRIISEELFRVDGDFPRLTRGSFPAGLPPGVNGISYSLSIAACGPWRLASSPFAEPASFLRATA